MVTDHRTSIVTSQFPHRQDTSILILFQQSIDETDILLRLNDSEQWMQGTECIPQGENGVHRLIWLSSMYLTIQTTIPSVDVGKQTWRNTCMIKCRIEHGLLVNIPPLNIYLTQILVPVTTGISLHSLKVPSRNLCQIFFAPSPSTEESATFTSTCSSLSVAKWSNAFFTGKTRFPSG